MIRTIADPVAVSGRGLHTGVCVETILCQRHTPGIVFARTDLSGVPEIPASIEYVSSAERCTVLTCEEARISTVEHLLATCFALGVNALRIEVSGPELPIGGGSAAIWSDAIKGRTLDLTGSVPVPVPVAPVSIVDGNRRIDIAPADTWSVHFAGAFPGGETREVHWEPQRDFCHEFAPARTFVPLSEVLSLRRAGGIVGGSLDNSVVCVDVPVTEELRRELAEFWPDVPIEVTGEGLLSPQSYRWPEEPARHKLVDLLGDLALAGPLPPCRVVAVQSGHSLSHRLVRVMAAMCRAADV